MINTTITDIIDNILNFEYDRELTAQIIKCTPVNMYLKEFKTLIFSFPRRKGNTTLAKEIYCFYDKYKPIYIGFNEYVSDYFKNLLIDDGKKPKRIYTFKTVDQLKGITSDSKIVIIDNQTNLSIKEEDKIYSIFSKMKYKPLIIKVG